ncbi:MAG TPA: pyridoxal-phosphate dependent enzyme [Thermoanaerobaculia bacterium]|nr:pyridoxal-phosphate dependent enzyme [Thermoanaerobaculia bacterium]
MKRLPLSTTVVDPAVRERNIERLRATGVALPKFSELADPTTIPEEIRQQLRSVDPDAAHPLNLYRVHWYNDRRTGGFKAVPDHVVLPPELTGINAKVIVLLGNRFPMIRAHKVLAAYACLMPRIVSGEFDITRQRAVWPSTGNYCRGGVAISRIVGCRGVALLPAGMSAERFRWLEKWVADPGDIVRTPGTESNVKEIYDACAELERDSRHVIFNQFSELANYLVHYRCTGAAAGRVFDEYAGSDPSLQLRAFVSATGSAGTIAAGDYLKDQYGSRIVAVEALECPTMLNNGFGEHRIQGIGDKHIPFIHNVMNTDMVVAVSDRATDALNILFNSPEGREFLTNRRHVPHGTLEQLASFGISSIANILAAIKTAKYYRMGPSDVVITVATDGAEMYESEAAKMMTSMFGGRFDAIDAATVYGQHMLGATTDHLLELTLRDRERIFDLGYFTWVEQLGYSVAEFRAREKQSYWRELQQAVPIWDALATIVNRQTAVAPA